MIRSVSATPRRIPLGRRLVFGFLIVAAPLAGLELGARKLDEEQNFRTKLVLQLRQKRTSPDPILARPDGYLTDIGWPPGGVSLRMNLDGPTLVAPYLVGGVPILDRQLEVVEVGLLPEMVPGADRKRVFLVGGSAAYGYPYGFADSVTARLDEALYPRGYFFLNAARPGWCSGELVPLVERLVTFYGMEALVLMTGNNEFIHWSDPTLPHVDPSPLEAMLRLSRSRALSWLFARRMRQAREQPDRTLVVDGFACRKELIGRDHALENPAENYPAFDPTRWDETRERFLDAFEANLDRMVTTAQAKPIPVVLVTLPFNYKLSPAWSTPQPEAFRASSADEVRAAVKRVAAHLDTVRFEEARRQARQALELDDRPPILHYMEAQALEALGRHREAEAAYARSRDNMIGNLGSLPSINDRIRALARRRGCHLVDAKTLFDEACHAAGQSYNEGLIRDDCHPTPRGHALLAEAIGAVLENMSADRDR